jgi:hypothetical protein
MTITLEHSYRDTITQLNNAWGTLQQGLRALQEETYKGQSKSVSWFYYNGL